MRIAVSSGHGLHVAGARDIIDEVAEARRVVPKVAEYLRRCGVDATEFHDNISRNQRDNINAIVNHHNGRARDLDVSVHFNAVWGTRDAGTGVEVCHRTGNAETAALASRTARAIADASGLILRRGDGTWARSDLAFLNRTDAPAILIEVCFVNSRTDVNLYRRRFDAICKAIAEAVSGRTAAAIEPGGSQVAGEELDILRRIAWAEARGEDDKGIMLVVNVIMNRVNSPRFPGNIRDVVFQPNQFSPTWNGAFERAMPDSRINNLVDRALRGEDYSQGALFFRPVAGAKGSWHETALARLFDHGAHRFYR